MATLAYRMDVYNGTPNTPGGVIGLVRLSANFDRPSESLVRIYLLMLLRVSTSPR
jgi:hypothetical protein